MVFRELCVSNSKEKFFYIKNCGFLFLFLTDEYKILENIYFSTYMTRIFSEKCSF